MQVFAFSMLAALLEIPSTTYVFQFGTVTVFTLLSHSLSDVHVNPITKRSDDDMERLAGLVAYALFAVVVVASYVITARRRRKTQSRAIQKNRSLRSTAQSLSMWAARPKDVDIMDTFTEANEDDALDSGGRVGPGSWCISEAPPRSSGCCGSEGAEETRDGDGRTFHGGGGCRFLRRWGARLYMIQIDSPQGTRRLAGCCSRARATMLLVGAGEVWLSAVMTTVLVFGLSYAQIGWGGVGVGASTT